MKFFKKIKAAREARKKKIEEYNAKKHKSKQAETVAKKDTPPEDDEQVPTEQAPAVNIVKSVSSGYMPSDTSAEPTTGPEAANKTDEEEAENKEQSTEDVTNNENKESSTPPDASAPPEPPMSPATVFSEQVSVIEPPRNLKKQVADDEEGNADPAQPPCPSSTGLLCGCI